MKVQPYTKLLQWCGGDSGIFFDDQNDKAPDAHFAFSKDCLAAVTKAYLPIIEKYVHSRL
jgi:coproporphyrinogen III oxidase